MFLFIPLGKNELLSLLFLLLFLSGSNPGVDFAAWKDAFSTIQNCKNDTISSAVMSGQQLTILNILDDKNRKTYF